MHGHSGVAHETGPRSHKSYRHPATARGRGLCFGLIDSLWVLKWGSVLEGVCVAVAHGALAWVPCCWECLVCAFGCLASTQATELDRSMSSFYVLEQQPSLPPDRISNAGQLPQSARNHSLHAASFMESTSWINPTFEALNNQDYPLGRPQLPRLATGGAEGRGLNFGLIELIWKSEC